MNREDVAMDVTVQNVEILRKEVQAAKLLLSECDEIFIEEGISNIELRGYLSGKLSADEVIELLDPPAEQRNQCDGCQAGIPLVDGAHRMGRPGGYPDLMSCQKERYKHPEQAEGAQGEREATPNPSCSMCRGSGYFCEFSTAETCWCCLPEPEPEETVEAMKARIESLKAGVTHMKQQRDAAIARATLAQPSPAPELERPEVVTHSDDAAVDRFSASMKQKLEAARAKGRSGWDDPSSCDVAFLAERLIEHLGKGNAGTFEDVANFAMMLHQRGAHPQVLAEAAGAIERDYLRIIQAQEEKWSGRFEVLEDEAKTLRRERDAAQARVAELEQCLYQMQEAAKSLSAPVAELEKQEPVAWALQRKSDGFVRATWNQKPSETQYEIAELDGDVIVPLYAAPVAQAGQVPDGWRVMRCTSSIQREGDQWEIYDPQGSGGVVSIHDVKDWAVRGLLDALADAPAKRMPTEAELEAAGLGYPLSKEQAVALWNDRTVVAPGGE